MVHQEVPLQNHDGSPKIMLPDGLCSIGDAAKDSEDENDISFCEQFPLLLCYSGVIVLFDYLSSTRDLAISAVVKIGSFVVGPLCLFS